jgi:exodeoxyribonuclease III
MKVLSLNVRSGGGNRWAAIFEFVDHHDPDIAVFLEWRRSPGPGPAEEWASRKQMHWMAACDGSRANGVGIASKRPSDWRSATPGPDHPVSMVMASFEEWTLLACYFPQAEAKRPYFDVCDDVADKHRDRPLLIIGDFNTGNQIVDKTPAGTKYVHADRFDHLVSSGGLTDLWRMTHGPDAREWTWSSGKNWFRLDHAFGNAPYIEFFNPECRYDHTPRERRLTDHSAIIVYPHVRDGL